MKIKFYTNPKLSKDLVHIGKNGQMRFKQAFAEKYKLEPGLRFQLGTDSDLKKPDAIYMIKDDNNGFKMSYSNSSFHINIKGVVEELDLKTPLMLKYEDYKDENFEGIKILLP